MIRLGVSACFMYPDTSRAVFGHKSLAYLEQDMARYLARPGVMPILIPDLAEKELFAFLDQLDGLVMQGGADLAPGTYGEEPIENGRWPGDSYRDQYELRIFDYMFKKKKPIFAICRGFQLANVYFAGTLYQDLTLQTKTSVQHRCAEKYDRIHHEVVCTEASLLADIYNQKSLEVNSVHHQGIKKLGKNLVIDATSAEDELIEAFHYKDMNEHYVLAVQWHPEFSATLGDTVSSPGPLLDHFLAAIKRS